MTLYLSVTIKAGESHIHYGFGFVFCVLAWIISIGNVVGCASVGPGGIRGVCDRRIRRGPNLLTLDEQDEAASYDSDDSYGRSPRNTFRLDASRVQQPGRPAPTVAAITGQQGDSTGLGVSDTTLHPL